MLAVHRGGPYSRSQPQETLRVAVRYPLPVGGAYREPIKEGACLCHRRVGVVGREHDPIDTDLKHQVEERLDPVEAAESVVEVLAEVGDDRTLQLRHLPGQRYLEPGQHERESLAHVPDHELQVLVPVERPTKDEAEDVGCRLYVPA